MAGARRAEGPAHGIRDTESGAVFGSPGAPCSLHATQARHPFESVSSNSLPRGAASARAAVDAALASRPPAAAAGPSGAQLSRAYSSGSGVTFQSVPAEFIGPPEADAKRHAPDVGQGPRPAQRARPPPPRNGYRFIINRLSFPPALSRQSKPL